MRGLSRLDEQGIKDLDDILDSQGGFTKEAAERHIKDFGCYSDQDEMLQNGCYSCIPDFEHKKKIFNYFLT